MDDVVTVITSWFESEHAAEQISVVATLIALGSLVVAIMSARNSSKALKLTQAQEQRRVAQLNISAGQATYLTRGGGRIYMTTALIENPSDLPGAVSTAELLVTYSRDGNLQRLALPVVSREVLSEIAIDVKRPPFDVPARSAVSAPLCFEAKPGLLSRLERIEGYELVATDALGNRYRHQFPGFINERMGQWET